MNDVPTLASTWQVIRRRRRYVLIPLLLVPVAAVVFSLVQTAKYQATAEVLLQRENLASALTGTPDTSVPVDDTRYAETQARLARLYEVGRRTLLAAHVHDRTIKQYLNQVAVSSSGNSDILTIAVQDEDPSLAKRLATAHADQFVAYRGQLETAAISKARSEIASRLKLLDEQGQKSTALFRSLQDKEALLATFDTLQTARATLVQTAHEARQVAPNLPRNTMLGIVLGILLGIAAALIAEALDTRVRGSDDVADYLGVPLLARLPEPPKKLRKPGQLAMFDDPTGQHAEAFRVLRTNLDLVTLESPAKRLLVTSALVGEGKTTSASNLAIALAQAGRRVILVDLDFRRPAVARMFDLASRPGVTHVAVGDVSLDEALVPIDGSVTRVRDSRVVVGGFDHGGELHVLPAGALPPNPGEFVGSRAVRELIYDLEARADIVIVDAPPLLPVGDAMTLSSVVSSVLVVSRLSQLRRGSLRDLRRLTDRMPAEVVGLVVTGTRSDASGYAADSDYGYNVAASRRAHKLDPGRFGDPAGSEEAQGRR